MPREEFEAEIERMLAVQRELQESQLKLKEHQQQQDTQIASLLTMVESLYRTSANVVETQRHQIKQTDQLQEQTAQLKRAVDYLLSKDGDAEN